MIKAVIELMKNNTEFYNSVRIDFTYHSSSIEGSTVTKDDHTKLANLKPGQTISDAHLSDISKENDAIENLNCLRLFDYVFKNINEKLSHELIQKYQFILKEGSLLHKNVPEETGKYRTTYVKVDDFDPPPHYKVYELMTNLIEDFNVRYPILLEDICEFHIRYESIHPFRDGNGRTGRMIAFKQCLQNGVIPFIVDNSTRTVYINCLEISHHHNDYSHLIKYCVNHQKIFMQKYKQYLMTNSFEQSNQSLERNERLIVEYLTNHIDATRIEIEKYLKLNERSTIVLLDKLQDKKLIERIGGSKNTIYKLIRN
ncbi:MAG: Fic family protein [Mycoplasmataceae bacterium]|jgi:Fic family protein|nr:Fic family protein [Mycoplasmataceae bacterium]